MLRNPIASRMTITLAEERFDQYRLCAEGNCNISEVFSLVDDAFLCWRLLIIPRDRISLTLGYDGESLTFTDLSDASLLRVHELLALRDQEDKSRIFYELTIYKVVQNQRLSLYSPELLGNYLASTPILQVLNILATRLNGNLIFECVTPIVSSGSESIHFQQVGVATDNSKIQQNAAIRNAIFEIFKDNCFTRSLPDIFVPHDFAIVVATGVSGIDNFFQKARTLVSAIYIANSAELRDNDVLEYRLCGYKNISGTSALADLADASELIYKVVDWAYKNGGSSDKIGLARNVLSLYINNLQDISSHPEVFHAIHSNYQIYLKENVESYLEVKGKITDVLVDAVKKTHDLVDSFVDSLKNGIFVLLTFVLTVVVVNGLKDTSASAIFSAPYIWVVITLCFLMSIWVLSSRSSTLKQFDKAYGSIDELLKKNYQGIVAEAEIDAALCPIRASNRKYLRRLSTHYVRIWLLIITLLIIGFVAGNLYFVPQHPVSAKVDAPAVQEVLRPSSTLAVAQPVEITSKKVPETSRSGSPLDRRVYMRKNINP